MYFLQGLLVGLATFAPIGMQNLFIINTALVQPLPRILLTITIIGLFDMTLSTAAFYGIGALLEAWPVFNLIILIAGGYDKHIPYDVLGKPICDHVKLLLLTGATAPKIRECVENIEGEHPPIIEVENLETAVQEAAARAESGDVVIMSPASASFDRFKNFMERGKLFKALVEEL